VGGLTQDQIATIQNGEKRVLGEPENGVELWGMPREPSETPKPAMRSRPQLTAAEAWDNFIEALSTALVDLKEDDDLAVRLKDTGYWVQVMDRGSFGVRAEAISGAYIKNDLLMKRQLTARLLEIDWKGLRWKAPTHGPDDDFDEHGLNKAEGSSYFYLDVAKPFSYTALSELMVMTLRTVYRAAHPGELAASRNGKPFQLPNLGIRKDRRVASIADEKGTDETREKPRSPVH
jgi:hypothetical protein